MNTKSSSKLDVGPVYGAQGAAMWLLTETSTIFYCVCARARVCVRVCVCVILQADPSGPSFQNLFNNTEQTLKVCGWGFLCNGGWRAGGVQGSRGGEGVMLLKVEFNLCFCLLVSRSSSQLVWCQVFTGVSQLFTIWCFRWSFPLWTSSFTLKLCFQPSRTWPVSCHQNSLPHVTRIPNNRWRRADRAVQVSVCSQVCQNDCLKCLWLMFLISLQCLKEPKMAACSALSCSPCWAVSMWKYVTIAIALLISESKVPKQV